MNNPEFDPEMLEDIDISGYSEKRTDKQIDKKDDSGTVQAAKQFNRLTQATSGLTKGGTFIPPIKVKKDKKDIEDNVVFEDK